MELDKNIKTFKQMGLDLILEGVELEKLNVPIKVTTYEEICNVNRKKFKKLRIKKLVNEYELMLKCFEQIITDYKELYNKTEYYERKNTFEYNFDEWNTIRKANGKLTKYYNELKKVFRNILEEE